MELNLSKRVSIVTSAGFSLGGGLFELLLLLLDPLVVDISEVSRCGLEVKES